MPENTVKIRNIDEPMRMPYLDTQAELKGTLWMEAPVTAQDVEQRTKQLEATLRRLLADSGNDGRIEQVMTANRIEARAGTEFTVRRIAVRAMYWPRHPLGKKDDKGNPVPEPAEVVADMHYIGQAFSRARPGGGVALTEDQVKLLRRKAYELGPQELLPAALGLFFEALDRALGDQVHARRVVEVLEPEEDTRKALPMPETEPAEAGAGA